MNERNTDTTRSGTARWVLTCLAGIGLAAGTFGCASKITMETRAIKTGLEVNPEYGSLTTVRESFKTTDAQAITWIEFSKAHGTHTTRFKWYNPDGNLVLDSGPIDIAPPSGQVFDRYRAWSTLPIKGHPAEMMPGKWKVEVYFDNKKIDSVKLSIS